MGISFEQVWRTFTQIEGTVVRSPVIKRPSLIISFGLDGLTRRTCRPRSQGGNWENPGESDWEEAPVVAISEFRRFWNRLQRDGYSGVSGVTWRIAAACFLAVPELGVEKVKDRPLTIKLGPGSEAASSLVIDDEDEDEFGDSERIVVDPEICSGKPTIRGTRIMVSIILGMFSGGYSINRVLNTYPQLSRLDVISALEYASWVVDKEKIIARG